MFSKHRAATKQVANSSNVLIVRRTSSVFLPPHRVPQLSGIFSVHTYTRAAAAGWKKKLLACLRASEPNLPAFLQGLCAVPKLLRHGRKPIMEITSVPAGKLFLVPFQPPVKCAPARAEWESDQLSASVHIAHERS